jgi:hypothetical protein
MFEFLDGKKTHLTVAAAVVAAIFGFLTGEMTLAEAVNASMVALGLSALRVAKK